MPPINVDLSDALRDPLPAGSVVRLRVEGCKQETASTGTLMAVWDFIVTDPMEDDPRHVFDNTMLTGPGKFRTGLLLTALGVPFGKQRPDLNGGFDEMECHGREVRASLDVEEYEGRKKNTVNKYMPL